MPQPLERRVLDYIRQHALLRPGDRAAVAVSGGADSVALLRLMLVLRGELGLVLSIAHFNHKIRGEASDADENFVRELAQAHDLELHLSSGDAPAHSQTNKLSLETAARDLRYSFFRRLISSGAVCKVMTAHTLDDQAETVLLRIVRGTGTAGLAGIYPRLKVPAGAIIRPLLSVRRSQIEEYLRGLAQPWSEDATNVDVKHARNRVRHLLLPLIEREFNPAAPERLAELAEIARAEEEQWDKWLPGLRPQISGQKVLLDLAELNRVGLAMQRRIIRRAAEAANLKLDFETTDAVQQLVGDAGGSVELPGGWCVRHQVERRPSGGTSGTFLLFEKSDRTPGAKDYQHTLAWPGEIAVPEVGITIRARPVEPAGVKGENNSGQTNCPSYNQSQLLDALRLLPELTVRNWRPGDRFWPSRTSGPKKIKELLQERHITGAERTSWPVILSGSDIIWVRGLPEAEQYRATSDSVSLLIIEVL